MTRVQVLYGPEDSARPKQVNRIVAQHWGKAVLLVPTSRLAAQRSEDIILDHRLPGAWGRPVMTFPEFVAGLLRAEGRAVNSIGEVERRLLLEGAVVVAKKRLDLSETMAAAMDTQGFVTHVERVITQLKQAAVTPEDFRARAARRRRAGAMDPVVAEVYDQYQAALHETGAYDSQGLFWEADLLCREKRPAALGETAVLALDCFDDFTPSEFTLLRSLANHLDTIVFGLSYDDAPARSDVYQTVRATFDHIRATFDLTAVACEAPEPKTFTEFASRHIFSRREPPQPMGLRPNIEVRPCQSFLQEMESLSRWVKALVLDEQVAPADVTVVCRDLASVAPALCAAFHEAGIPTCSEARLDVAHTGVGAFFDTLVEALSQWQRDKVIDVMRSCWYRPSDRPEADLVRQFPLVARAAGIIAGRREWPERLGQLTRRLESDSGEEVQAWLRRAPRFREAATALRAEADRLEEWARGFPTEACMGEWAEVCHALLAGVGVDEALDTMPDSSARQQEERAIVEMRGILDRFGKWEAHAPDKVTRSLFLRRLRRAMETTDFEDPCRDRQGVCLQDLASARFQRYDHVFLACANEGSLPRPTTTSAIYSDEDIDDFVANKVYFEARSVRSRRELLLFHHLLDVPRRELVISWHARSHDGKARVRSPYLTDLAGLFAEQHPISRSMPEAAAFVPELAQVASRRELRNALFLRCDATDPLRNELADRFGLEERGAAIEQRRNSSAPFDTFDGILEDAQLRNELAQRFDTRHQFSVGQLETWLECPFRFFVKRVLGIDDVEMPEAEFDPRVRGTILHDVLEAFHRHFRGRPVPLLEPNEAREVMAALLDKQFERHAWRSDTAPEGLVQAEKAHARLALERYLVLESDPKRGNEEWRPEHFEVSFGRAHGECADSICSAEPFVLETAQGLVKFAGRIDRVDFRGDNESRIVDYKTSYCPSLSTIEEGLSIQLPLYGRAIETLAPGRTCVTAEFLVIGRAQSTVAFSDGRRGKKREVVDAATIDAVGRAVERIRAGCFPPDGVTRDACKYCPAKRVCRAQAARIERKEAAGAVD